MFFEYQSKKSNVPGKFSLEEDFSLFYSIGGGDFSILPGEDWRIELNVDSATGKCINVQGTLMGAIKSCHLEMPQGYPGDLFFHSEKELISGEGCHYFPFKDELFLDSTKRILCVGDREAKGVAIEFADKIVAVLGEGRLLAIYLDLKDMSDCSKNLFQEKKYDVLARVYNKRSSPFKSGYRPAHRVCDGVLTTGVHTYIGVDMLPHGVKTKAYISFIAPREYKHTLWFGKVVPFYEGNRLTGYAVIEEIYNDLLIGKEKVTSPRDRIKKKLEKEKRKGIKRRKKNNEITSDEFVKISIRGRVAYGICCLENAMLRYGISGEGWNMLLRRMWEFTTLSSVRNKTYRFDLEKWTNLLDYLPDDESFFRGDYEKFVQWMTDSDGKPHYAEELPAKEGFEKLCDSYQAHDHETIKKMCRSIFEIGSDEMYAGIDEKSQLTLDELQALLDSMYAEKIPMPEVEPFRQYDFDRPGWDYDVHGWGEPFDGTKYSKFIGEGV